MNGLFSPRGRLNRARYLVSCLAIGMLVEMASFLSGLLVGVSLGEAPEPVAAVLGGTIGLAGTVMMACEVVKRLHDLERPGTHFWYLLIPFYNLYLGLLLLFKRGTSGPNQYGDDPLAAPQVTMATATPAA
jgi:uncharacterized membrane protein YhaH (DUF805 family)